jgi:hypothetical protein
MFNIPNNFQVEMHYNGFASVRHTADQGGGHGVSWVEDCCSAYLTEIIATYADGTPIDLSGFTTDAGLRLTPTGYSSAQREFFVIQDSFFVVDSDCQPLRRRDGAGVDYGFMNSMPVVSAGATIESSEP